MEVLFLVSCILNFSWSYQLCISSNLIWFSIRIAPCLSLLNVQLISMLLTRTYVWGQKLEAVKPPGEIPALGFSKHMKCRRSTEILAKLRKDFFYLFWSLCPMKQCWMYLTNKWFLEVLHFRFSIRCSMDGVRFRILSSIPRVGQLTKKNWV